VSVNEPFWVQVAEKKGAATGREEQIFEVH
jgi:hypothetical protein